MGLGSSSGKVVASPNAGVTDIGLAIAEEVGNLAQGAGVIGKAIKKVGSYVAKFKSGATYVGKGSPTRMKESARTQAKRNNTSVQSMHFDEAANNREAFKDEYLKQLQNSAPGGTSYNKIWSPGKKYFEQDLENILKD